MVFLVTFVAYILRANFSMGILDMVKNNGIQYEKVSQIVPEKFNYFYFFMDSAIKSKWFI